MSCRGQCCLAQEFIGTWATMYAVRLGDGEILYAFDCLSRVGGTGAGGSCDTNSDKVFNVASGPDVESNYGFSIAAYDKTTFENLWINDIVDVPLNTISSEMSMYADDSYVWVVEPNGRGWCYDQADGTEVGTLESESLADFQNIMSGSGEGRVCIGGRVEYDQEFTETQTSPITTDANLSPNASPDTAIDIGSKVIASYIGGSSGTLDIYCVDKGALANPFFTLRSAVLGASNGLRIADSSHYVINIFTDYPVLQLRGNRSQFSVNGEPEIEYYAASNVYTPAVAMSSEGVYAYGSGNNIAKYSRDTPAPDPPPPPPEPAIIWETNPGVGKSHLTAIFDETNSQLVGIGFSSRFGSFGDTGTILRALADSNGDVNWETDLLSVGLRVIQDDDIVFVALPRHPLEDPLPDSV